MWMYLGQMMAGKKRKWIRGKMVYFYTEPKFRRTGYQWRIYEFVGIGISNFVFVKVKSDFFSGMKRADTFLGKSIKSRRLNVYESSGPLVKSA